jgi:predicted MFS family arabinose efflux permease
VVAAAWLALSSHRAVLVATAVLLAYVTRHPPDVAVDRVDDPLLAARKIAEGLPPEGWRLALAAGAAVAALRFVRTGWRIAFWGSALIALTLLPNPSVAALPVIALVWGACLGLAVTRAK